jgi:hypothetical protein
MDANTNAVINNGLLVIIFPGASQHLPAMAGRAG